MADSERTFHDEHRLALVHLHLNVIFHSAGVILNWLGLIEQIAVLGHGEGYSKRMMREARRGKFSWDSSPVITDMLGAVGNGLSYGFKAIRSRIFVEMSWEKNVKLRIIKLVG